MAESRTLKTDAVVYFGADPEIFLESNGKIVGSEHAIPEEGVIKDMIPSRYALNGPVSLVRDGVQIELNLPPAFCREWFILEIRTAFKALKTHLESKKDSQFVVSFKQVVDVDQEELKKLSKMSRRLGCQPSFNWYNPVATIGVDPDTYTKRSAGGHFHFGLPPHLMSNREHLAPICDTIMGLSSVLIDRCPEAAERRKVYGRAGEFRLPRHGFEYRTLSNFWLRSKELVSLFTGLQRLCVFILDTAVDEKGWTADQALFELVNLQEVEKAINENNLELARTQFLGVKEFLHRHLPVSPIKETGLDGSNLNAFDAFIKGIDEGGIERWFPEDPMTHWLKCDWLRGWESFLEKQVTPDIKAA